MSSLVSEEITEEFARQRGMVPNGTGGWKIPFYESVRVKGLFVPLHHVDLYERLHKMLGDLVLDPSRLVGVSLMLMQAVTCTLDMITEIESASARKTELSRDLLDDWLEMLGFMTSSLNFSERWILWLRPQVEELDQSFRRSDSVAKLLSGDDKLFKELHSADPELADGIRALLAAKAAKAAMDPSPRPTKRPHLLPCCTAPVAAPSASESQPAAPSASESQPESSQDAASKGVLNVVE